MPVDVRAAVANNVAWCDGQTRRAGGAPVRDADAWSCPTRTPPRYPDAITLRPGVDPARLLDRIDAGPGCSIKDSFADLDLAGHGFSVLFRAEWIHRPSTVDLPSGGWEYVPLLWDGPDIVRLGGMPGSGVTGNRTGNVVGLSNLDDGGWADLGWIGAVRGLARCFPGLDLVGYERGDDLAAARRVGFVSLGPLRVWHRP